MTGKASGTAPPSQSASSATRAQARKILRQACHILAELGDDALSAA